MQVSKTIAILLLAVCMTHVSFGQYFSTLHDYDSTGDAGLNVFLNSNGTFQVWNGGANRQGGQSISTLNIGADGIQLNWQGGLDFGRTLVSFGAIGNLKKVDENNYYSAINIFGYAPGPARAFGISGFAKLNQFGDTLLFRRYTDSSRYMESPIDCIKISGGKYLLGGSRRTNLPNALDSALLRCIDSNGNELWARTYQKMPGTYASFSNLALLPNGQILAGVECLSQTFKIYPPDPNSFDYYRRVPWFMILDTLGNIVRDTIYGDTSQHLIGSARIYKDMNGGYFHIGSLDSFFMPSPNYDENIPNYLAHLDTNFRFLWRTNFADTQGKKFIYKVKQLQDGGYLVVGSLGITGWMAKVNAQGHVVWDHHYVVDVLERGYISDAVELPNGYIVATGSNSSTALPLWRGDDMWLLKVDANGCEVPRCSSGVNVPILHQLKEGTLMVYPNPVTSGKFTASVSTGGEIGLFDITGHLITKWYVVAGANDLQLPDQVSNGVFFARFITSTKQFGLVIKLFNIK